MTYRSLAELHRLQAERLGPRVALRFKRHGLYHDLSWNDYLADSLACAAALVDAGVGPGDRVGLLAENRVEWLAADMGILAAGGITVSPHAPLTASQVSYQLADAGVSWLFVSTQGQLDKVRQVRAGLPALRGVVVFDGACQAYDAQSWAGFLQRGPQVLPSVRQELDRRLAALSQEDLAAILYTSGTTGNPKGVMLTHGNLLSNALAVLAVFPLAAETLVLSWLPFSHIYARTVDHYLGIVAGTILSLAESPETVVANLQEVRPTHLNGVPRFYEKLYAAAASADPHEVGRRLRRFFGSRLEWLGSGGAPLPPPVAAAYQAAGLLVLQGYGLTECSPVITFNQKVRHKIDTVGLPLPGVEVALAADGEVLTRGPHVMKGYWNNPQATAEVLRNGWLHTGDLGQIDADGFLTLTGRKKDLLVLSNGKKLVPTYLEGLLVADPCIDQVVVYGEGRSYLTALIVPNWDNLRQALPADPGMDGTSAETLSRQPAVRDLLESRVRRALTEVANWEQVRKFLILPHPFTLDADELTVSLKLRRNVILARHRTELDALYKDDEKDEG